MELIDCKVMVWFGVEELAQCHQGIRLHFPVGWYVYYLNSHEECGCGFHTAEFPCDDVSYDQESRSHLAAYLRRALTDPDVELALYDCWEGDEGEPIHCRVEATPDQLEHLPDPVPEGTFVQVLR